MVATANPLARYLTPGVGPVDFVMDTTILPTGDRLRDVISRDAWLRDDVLVPVFAVDADGLPRYRRLFLQLHRGAGKTGVAAAVALAEVILHPSTEVIACAADSDQARLLLEACEGYLSRSELLRSSCEVFKGEVRVPSNGSRIRIISSDVASSWGVGGTHNRLRIMADELTMWSDTARPLYDSLASATVKVKDSQVITITNAGFAPDEAWQWRIRQAADYLYAPPGVIASWIRPEDVERQRRELPPPTFARLFDNSWVNERGDFVSAAQYDGCVDVNMRPVYQGAHGGFYFAGLDLGRVKDRTALAVGHLEGAAFVLDALQIWQGSQGAPVSIAEVEMALLDYARRFPSLTVYCDPYELRGSVERLRGQMRITEFAMTAGSVSKLSHALFAAITGRGVRLYPDADLRSEALNLVTVQTGGTWRMDHKRGGHNDRATALALAITAAQSDGTVMAHKAFRLMSDMLGRSLAPVEAEPAGQPYDAAVQSLLRGNGRR